MKKLLALGLILLSGSLEIKGFPGLSKVREYFTSSNTTEASNEAELEALSASIALLLSAQNNPETTLSKNLLQLQAALLQKEAGGWTKGQKAAATVVVAGVVLAGAALAFYKADPDRAIAMLEAAKARDLSTFTNIAKEVPQALRESEGYNSFLTTVSSNYSWAKESVANLISSIWQRVPSLPAWFKGSQAAEIVATEAQN